MFPNPQDALPLPRHPDLDQYRKLAKDLSKACRSGSNAIRAWTAAWVKRLVEASGLAITPDLPVRTERWTEDVDVFARTTLTDKDCALTAAQVVLARSHGFPSWPKFAEHVEALRLARFPAAQFERAADAIVTGDATLLRQLLEENPDLVRQRSSRDHHATLLHYVSANGVEGYRQRTPPNAVAIAAMLLDAGAEVDVGCDVYGGHCTTLGLTATSVHPRRAGVQEQLLQLLLDRGARMQTPGLAGGNAPLVVACLANGQPAAARFLADRGAPLDLEAAAGIGRLDVVQSSFDAHGTLKPITTKRQLQRGFLWACAGGHDDVVEFLLHRGADLREQAGTGEAALHWAVIGAQAATISLLLAHGAPLEEVNAYGATALGQAGWSFVHGSADTDYVPVFEVLLGAGAKVEEGWLGWLEKQKDPSPEAKARIADVLRRYGARS